MHISLFANGHSSDEVYRPIVVDMKRDSKAIQFLDIATVGCLIGGLNNWMGYGNAFWVGFFLLSASGLRFFIDQSNRKHLLHKLDWEHSIQFEKAGIK